MFKQKIRKVFLTLDVRLLLEFLQWGQGVLGLSIVNGRVKMAKRLLRMGFSISETDYVLSRCTYVQQSQCL